MAHVLPHEVGDEAAPSRLRLLATLAALLALAGASWALAHAALARIGWCVALAIAGIKAFLVVWNFMELYARRFLLRFIAALLVLYVLLLCSGVLFDGTLR